MVPSGKENCHPWATVYALRQVSPWDSHAVHELLA